MKRKMTSERHLYAGAIRVHVALLHIRALRSHATVDELVIRMHHWNTNFALEPDSQSLCTASIPFKTGMLISVTTTSGLRLWAFDTNAAPSAAVPTTKWGSRELSPASAELDGHRLIGCVRE